MKRLIAAGTAIGTTATYVYLTAAPTVVDAIHRVPHPKFH